MTSYHMRNMSIPTKSQRIHDGNVFSVDRLTFETTEGPLIKDVVRHPGAVTVIAVASDGRLVMIRNHRVAVGARLLELCAGKLEPDEDPKSSAVRELEEETGFSAASVVPLGRFYTSPGFADELMHVFEARDLTPVPRRLEPGEDIEVVMLTREEVEDAIRSGALCDGKTIAAFHLWCLVHETSCNSHG